MVSFTQLTTESESVEHIDTSHTHILCKWWGKGVYEWVESEWILGDRWLEGDARFCIDGF